MEHAATRENFDEQLYLLANPDVVQQIASGGVRSAHEHLTRDGLREGRPIRLPVETISAAKAAKRDRMRPILRSDMRSVDNGNCVDFLTDDLRAAFDIVETDAVSAHDYDPIILGLVERNSEGLVLDCGSGMRRTYFSNVVNFEIVDYDTTDVLGVGEELPFRDECFDAVISTAVLEHVKDPFRCAEEIVRVLKPGGELICTVPFLQPVHAYPNHFYNMTAQGLQNLFADQLTIKGTSVHGDLRPLYSVRWILNSWALGLSGRTRRKFERMRVGDLMGDPTKLVDMPFVTELSDEKNRELACAVQLSAVKPLSS